MNTRIQAGYLTRKKNKSLPKIKTEVNLQQGPQPGYVSCLIP